MNTAQQRGRGGLPGGPRKFFGGVGGVLLLGAGAVVINNALFNGKCVLQIETTKFQANMTSGRWPSSHQVHKGRWCTERDL